MVPYDHLAHVVRYSMGDDNRLTLVRVHSCLVIGNNEQNTYPLLRSGRQFVDEFHDAFEIEVVLWGDGYLKEYCNSLGDVDGVDGFRS